MNEASLEDLHTELMWRKCAPDWDTSTVEQKAEAFEFFCENFWMITRPPRGRVPFKLYPAQKAVARAWLGNRYTVALKARQIGFTTLTAAYVFWVGYFYDDRPIILVSKTQEASRQALLKVKYGWKLLPEWMRLRGPHAVNETQSELVFANGSAIYSLPSLSEPGRGMTTFLSVIDEIGFLPNSDEAYAAIEPTADIGGSLIMLGTANGEGNLLHKLWQGSQGVTLEYSQYVGIFHSWSANGRDQEWYDAKAKTTPEWQMAQEYPRDPEEAFLKSGRPVFNLDAVRENPVADPWVRGYLRQIGTEPIQFVEDGGSLRIWRAPEDAGVYVIGADVAEGLEHGDYSVAQVIEVHSNEVVACWHGHIEPDLFGSDILNLLGQYYNNALLGVERNASGGTTLQALKRANYPNLWYQVRKGQKWEQKTELLGWITHIQTKRLAIDELDMALRGAAPMPLWDEEIEDFVEQEGPKRGEGALTIFDGETCAELKTYTRNEKGQTSGSPHDDRVMALAIANQMIQYAYEPHYRVRAVKNELGYLMIGNAKVSIDEMLGEGKKKTEVTPLGAFSVRKPHRAVAFKSQGARIRL